MTSIHLPKRWLKPISALFIVGGLYWATRLPEVSAKERLSLTSHFQFQRNLLPRVPGYALKNVRGVNPRLEKVSAWISSVGAAVTLSDIDGDGLPNDVCYVDTKTDQVIVTPVPGTGGRYQPFVLNPAPLRYDANTMAPMGCLALDLNEDGLTDIVVYYWGRTPVAFLQRRFSQAKDLTAENFRPVEIMPAIEDWYTNAALAADLDGDGHVDLVFGNFFADGSRILDTRSTYPAEMQDSMSRAYNGGSKHFLLWESAGSGDSPQVQFSEQRNILQGDDRSRWTLAMAACDLDGDLLPEIYIANDFGPDVLLHNLSTPGHLRFQRLMGRRTPMTPASKVLGHDSFKGMGVDCGDLNQDGIPDLAIGNITSEFALEESNLVFLSTGDLKQMQSGIAPYREASEALGLSRNGWSWDVRFGDFDNEGALQVLQAAGFVKGSTDRWPELHESAMGNDNLLRYPGSWPRLHPGDDLSGHDHNSFFVPSASGRYVDLSRDVGLDEPQVTRGIATADVDGDGLLDFAVGNQWEDSAFYHNQTKSAGNFLQLYLLLPVDGADVPATKIFPGHPSRTPLGRYAIGASATLHLPNGKLMIQQVDTSNGHSGKRSAELHFGLGQLPATASLTVDLAWRDTRGAVHRETLQLSPGLHTILLASPQRRNS
ncbi:MAG TPA: CRTAC1 family protein [Candidatus Angelobacter sp.]|nr:CRTAC1 family protein [Candidatus Angelobacter sp.]